jgi:5-formyltetrahydrofolate cyclo-ligase
MAPDSTPSITDPLDAEKAGLRRRARLIRNAISTEQRQAAADRVAQIGLPDGIDGPGVVSGYYPTPREFDPLPLLRRLAADGWTLTLPAIAGEAPLVFHGWAFGAPLIPGQRGIMEPASGDILRPAVLLIPLLAFDASGGRLGYGGGHYDRTLEALRREGPVKAIGLAFDAQEMPHLPFGPHDQRLDYILTPSGARRFTE